MQPVLQGSPAPCVPREPPRTSPEDSPRAGAVGEPGSLELWFLGLEVIAAPPAQTTRQNGSRASPACQGPGKPSPPRKPGRPETPKCASTPSARSSQCPFLRGKCLLLLKLSTTPFLSFWNTGETDSLHLIFPPVLPDVCPCSPFLLCSGRFSLPYSRWLCKLCYPLFKI